MTSRFFHPVVSLSAGAMVPQVQQALNDLLLVFPKGAVIIGGVALAFYARPRHTEDVDLLFLTRPSLLSIDGFKRTLPGALTHLKTGVEIELVDARSLGIDPQLVDWVIDHAVAQGRGRVASLLGLIARKLASASSPRRYHRDLGDIQAIAEVNKLPPLPDNLRHLLPPATTLEYDKLREIHQ